MKADLTEYFSSLSLHGISLTDGQKQWYEKKRDILGDDILREYPSTPEEAFQASQEGHWYAVQMKEMWDIGHITNVSYNAAMPVYTAWDLGQADFTAIWFFQLNRTGDINIIDYLQRRDTPLDQLTAILNSRKYTYSTCIWPPDANARDRAGITFVNQARVFGWNGIVLDQHRLRDGIDLVRATLGRCWIDREKCKEGIAALENYKKKWSPIIGGWSSEPLHDDNSHGCFIGETLITTPTGDRRIDSLGIGDKVITPMGIKRISQVFQYETSTLRKISTKNIYLICTPNHKIFTDKGLVHADTLRYNDTLYTLNQRELCQKLFGSKSTNKNIGFRENFSLAMTKFVSSSMDTSTVGMDSIIQVVKQRLIHFLDCIEQCGDFIMERLQMVFIFIISITIPEIMRFPICASLAPLNIPFSIMPHKDEIIHERLSKLPWKRLKNGMEARKELNGIENMDMKAGLLVENGNLSVVSVITIMNLIGQILNIAQIPARQNGESDSNLILKNECAKFARNISELTNMPLQRHVVENVELNLPTTQKVYDLEVEEDHCYYANGFLVSNSDALRYLCAGLPKIEGKGGTVEKDFKALREFWGA